MKYEFELYGHKCETKVEVPRCTCSDTPYYPCAYCLVGEVDDGPRFECRVCNVEYRHPADAAECEDRCAIEEKQALDDEAAYFEWVDRQDFPPSDLDELL